MDDMGNKIMDNQNRTQIKQDNQSQQEPSLLSDSRTSGNKKVGTIIRRRSNTEAGDHSSSLSSRPSHTMENKLPTPQPIVRVTPMSRNSKNLLTTHEIAVDNHGRLLGMGLGSSKINKHVRSKSYQEQRAELQKELMEVTQRKNQIEQLRENKKKLKIKLNQLEVQLKQIKNNRNIQRMNHLENANKIQALKQLKHPKLKPIRLRENTKPAQIQQHMQQDQQKAEPERVEVKKPRKQTNRKHAYTHHSSSQEQQPTNYYYQAQLNHKCLDCKHYHIKKQDVRIPSQVKNEFNL